MTDNTNDCNQKLGGPGADASPIRGGGLSGSPSLSAFGTPLSNAPDAFQKLPTDPKQVDALTQITAKLADAGEAIDKVQSAIPDCICKALDRVAAALERPVAETVGKIADKLQQSQSAFNAVRTEAYGKIGGAIEAASISDNRVMEGIKPYLDNDSFVQGKTLDLLFADAPQPGVGTTSPTPDANAGLAVPLTVAQLLRNSGDVPDNDRKKLDSQPGYTPFPKIDTSNVRDDQWRVWYDPILCITYITAPNTGPDGTNLNLVSGHDTAKEASDAEKALRASIGTCPPPNIVPKDDGKYKNWNNIDKCDELATELHNSEAVKTPTLASLFGLEDGNGKDTLPPSLGEFTILTMPIGKLAGALARVTLRSFDGLAKLILDGDLPGQREAVGYNIRAFAGRLLQKWIGVEIKTAYVPHEYAANYLSPTELPGASEAVEGYGNGRLTRDEAECIGRANGRLPNWFGKQLDAAESIPDAQQALYLQRRGVIDDKTAELMIKYNGWLKKSDRKALDALSEPLPSLSDIVHLMTRDAVDEDLVKRFGLDGQFNDKYSGLLKLYGDWQNVPEQLMRYYWRAHWEIPSPEQLFTFYHRLRNRKEGDDARITFDDIKAALIQQDIPEFWIPKYLETSFKPLTRQDTIRGFELGKFTKTDVENAYRQLGYNDDNVRLMTNYTIELVVNRLMNKPETRAFINGSVEWDDVQTVGPNFDKDGDVGKLVFAKATVLKRIKRDTKCASGIKGRYLKGEFTNLEAVKALTNFGIANATATAQVDQWGCFRRSMDLKPTIAVLSRWLADGLLTYEEYASRLKKLGFTDLDAYTYADTVLADAREKQFKSQQKIAKQMEALNTQRVKASGRQQKNNTADVKAKAKEATDKIAAEKRRNSKLDKAATQLSALQSTTLDAALAVVREAYNRALSARGPGWEDAAAEAVMLAVKAWKTGGNDVWQIAIEFMAPLYSAKSQ